MHLPAGSAALSRLAGRMDPFEQRDSDRLSRGFSDRLQDFSFHGQLVIAVSQCHKRTLEWASVDGPFDLHQSARPKEGG